MRYICVVCLCSIISVGNSLEHQSTQDAIQMENPNPPLQFSTKKDSSTPSKARDKPKLEFPVKEIDVSTPILVGDDPTKTKLPPKIFPTKQDKSADGHSIVTGVDVKASDPNHVKDHESSLPNDGSPEKVNITLKENITKPGTQEETKDESKQASMEQDDMLHSKYKGGQDVDELRPAKKVSEKDEKKEVVPKKDPKSEVSVSSTLDKNGPKSMNETKTKARESMLESTSKMMAVSSSVFANTQPQQHGIIEPGKTVLSVILTGVALMCFGVLGLLVWKRIAMRRFGRDVLINEDDFDEVADMHTFDRAQIQIT